jgi:DNA invertase Pin-like site-specific DNA recombinase
MSKSVISYIQVSTSRQGRSGLGLEAQREAIARFSKEQGYTVADDYVEVESGKGTDALDRRPKLAAAIKAAELAKRTFAFERQWISLSAQLPETLPRRKRSETD